MVVKRNLEPERCRGGDAALAFHPEAIPGLEAELTWFDIDYTDRVVRPFSNTGEALSNAIYAEFVVFHPPAEQQAEFIANAVFTNFPVVDYVPANLRDQLRVANEFVSVCETGRVPSY